MVESCGEGVSSLDTRHVLGFMVLMFGSCIVLGTAVLIQISCNMEHFFVSNKIHQTVMLNEQTEIRFLRDVESSSSLLYPTAVLAASNAVTVSGCAQPSPR